MLYDVGSSAYPALVVSFVLSTYFAQSLAPDPETGLSLWGLVKGAAGLVVALLAPVLGLAADLSGRGRRVWIGGGLVAIAATAVMVLARPGGHGMELMLAALFISAIGFELSMAAYNALLPAVAGAGRLGRLSGAGWGAGYVGAVAASALAMVLLVGEAPLIPLAPPEDLAPRSAALLAAGWYLLFALPAFMGVRVQVGPPDRGAHGFWPTMRERVAWVWSDRRLRLFFLARLFYQDGLAALATLGGLFAAAKFGLRPGDAALLAVVILLSSACGSVIGGWVADRFGAAAVVRVLLPGLVLAVLCAILPRDFASFMPVAVLIGLFNGPLYSVSRSLMAELAPPERRGQLFGFYALSGRLTAFAGPMAAAAASSLAGSADAALFVIAAFLLAGWAIFRRLPKS